MALGGILIEAGIGPLADSGLNKAFGFAVGAWSVDAGANMFKLEFAASGGEAVGVEAGTIVGHDAAHYDAKTCEVQHRFPKNAAGGRGGFIRQHSGGVSPCGNGRRRRHAEIAQPAPRVSS